MSHRERGSEYYGVDRGSRNRSSSSNRSDPHYSGNAYYDHQSRSPPYTQMCIPSVDPVAEFFAGNDTLSSEEEDMPSGSLNSWPSHSDQYSRTGRAHSPKFKEKRVRRHESKRHRRSTSQSDSKRRHGRCKHYSRSRSKSKDADASRHRSRHRVRSRRQRRNNSREAHQEPGREISQSYDSVQYEDGAQSVDQSNLSQQSSSYPVAIQNPLYPSTVQQQSFQPVVVQQCPVLTHQQLQPVLVHQQSQPMVPVVVRHPSYPLVNSNTFLHSATTPQTHPDVHSMDYSNTQPAAIVSQVPHTFDTVNDPSECLNLNKSADEEGQIDDDEESGALCIDTASDSQTEPHTEDSYQPKPVQQDNMLQRILASIGFDLNLSNKLQEKHEQEVNKQMEQFETGVVDVNSGKTLVKEDAYEGNVGQSWGEGGVESSHCTAGPSHSVGVSDPVTVYTQYPPQQPLHQQMSSPPPFSTLSSPTPFTTLASPTPLTTLSSPPPFSTLSSPPPFTTLASPTPFSTASSHPPFTTMSRYGASGLSPNDYKTLELEFVKLIITFGKELEALNAQRKDLSSAADLMSNSKMQGDIKGKLAIIQMKCKEYAINYDDLAAKFINAVGQQKNAESRKAHQQNLITINTKRKPASTSNPQGQLNAGGATKQNPVAVNTPEVKVSVSRAYFDAGQHWCSLCMETYIAAEDYLHHLYSEKHSKLVHRMYRCCKTDESTDKSACDDNAYKSPSKGLEFITLSYYCHLCNVSNHNMESAVRHFESSSHNHNYQAYIDKQPDYEVRLRVQKKSAAMKEKSRARRYEKVCGQITQQNTSLELPRPAATTTSSEVDQCRGGGRASALRVAESKLPSDIRATGDGKELAIPEDIVSASRVKRPPALTPTKSKISIKLSSKGTLTKEETPG